MLTWETGLVVMFRLNGDVSSQNLDAIGSAIQWDLAYETQDLEGVLPWTGADGTETMREHALVVRPPPECTTPVTPGTRTKTGDEILDSLAAYYR